MKKTMNWFLAALLILSGSISARAEEVAATSSEKKPLSVKQKVMKKRVIKKKMAPPAAKAETDKKADAPATSPAITEKSSAGPSGIRPALSAWLKRMKNSVNSSQAKHNKLVAVAAVRGAEAEDAPPLYWKGNKKEAQVQMPELKEFDEAIESALKGNNEEAKIKLDTFVTAHPESPLVADAKETIRLMEEDQKVAQ